MTDLAAQNDFVEVQSLGASFEKRDLTLIKVNLKSIIKLEVFSTIGIKKVVLIL